MSRSRDSGLTIALVYDPKAYYLELGYAQTDCADLADEVTIKALSGGLERLGHCVVHVPGIKPLVRHLAAGDEKNWDLVFNFSEGVHGSSRESQVPALLEAYEIPFTFSDAATLSICIDKAKTKMLLQHYHIPTSPFVLIPSSSSDVDYATLAKGLSYPLFAKPVAASTSNGIMPSNKIMRQEDLKPIIDSLRAKLRDQDIMLEEFLDGTEYTVAIIGSNNSATVLGALEVTSYNQDGHEEGHPSIDFATSSSKAGRGPGQDMGHIHADIKDPVVKRVAEVALSAYRALSCRDGARVDVRFSSQRQDAVPNVIEVNPIFGLRDDYSQFTCIARNNGLEYHDILAKIIASTLERRSLRIDRPTKS